MPEDLHINELGSVKVGLNASAKKISTQVDPSSIPDGGKLSSRRIFASHL